MYIISMQNNRSQELQSMEPKPFHITSPSKSITGKTWDESKKMWAIAAPAILASVAQFSIGVVTVAFVGHLGEVELAAVSTLNRADRAEGLRLRDYGMGSALETLCGQAVGAGRYDMLGIYMQRSCIITIVTSLLLLPFYIFTSPILKLLGRSHEMSDVAGKYAQWVTSQLFANALNSPLQKFLQAQSRIWVMTNLSLAFLGFHVLLNWILVAKLDKGLAGAAIAENVSWWLLVLAQVAYVAGGFFPKSWTGFSVSAFNSLVSFLKLSLSSAVMLCLGIWYYTIVILLVGWLKNPEIAVDAISICMNVELWVLMITLVFSAAISVRVGNELGANNPKAAKFSVAVAVITSTLFGAVFTVAVIASKNTFPKLFSSKEEVIKETSNLAYFLAATIFLNSFQAALHGMAGGAGWQVTVAVINGVCYYLFGIPFGALLGYKQDLGVKGIWLGMLQIIIFSLIMSRANWTKEALEAEERVRSHSHHTPYSPTP